ncbi:MAG: hypothetical protein R3A79_19705 [Nannocystaceae bacterium]
MDPSAAIELPHADLHALVCKSCNATLDLATVRRGVCPTCQSSCAIGEAGIADAVAIEAARAALQSQIDAVRELLDVTQKETRIPLLNPTLAWLWLLGQISTRLHGPISWENVASSFGWLAPLRAPLFADAAGLHRLRLRLALIAWAARLQCVSLQAQRPYAQRVITILAVFVASMTLMVESDVMMIIPTWLYAPALIASLYVACIPDLGAQLRGFASHTALRAYLRGHLREEGVEVRAPLTPFHIYRWLAPRWAAPHPPLRGTPLMVRGGADVLDVAVEAVVYLRRTDPAEATVVVFVPMVDPRGAIAPNAALFALTEQALERLSARGWSIDEPSGAGLLATRQVGADEDMIPGTWRGIAADIAALLEAPAGLGMLSSNTALARLAAPEYMANGQLLASAGRSR